MGIGKCSDASRKMGGITLIELVKKKRSAKNVYLHFVKDEYYKVKKLPIDKYHAAINLCNEENLLDFLYLISSQTGERDEVDSYYSVAF